ncbi:STAS domain-containing protein [Streptomyces sp. SID13666]|uniref:STAS domain-containing protein n=1 Tax=unclassified Streptomyces TaxID=2593676 RepID=UPI0013BECD4A|nr:MULTISPECIES: STAS domain-containing protein [unclassified Streptomyces]NEA57154.1 STAS domain-containing protein [Streptomyces sp. SID13666]NEA76898.1 STAS domain-containing protein [Streptomyces sp. SID13588]QNA71986.1 STAS domain-containing protein [Streptomyces sp. So13.3]
MPERGWKAWRAARALRRIVHVHRNDRERLVVSLHGEINHANAAPIGQLLAALLQASPTEAHLDFVQVPRLGTAAASLFFPLMAAARSHRTTLIVHRADPSLRAALHELGLDRTGLSYSGDPI